MSFGGSRVGALGAPGTPLRPAGSRKNILEPGGAGGAETDLPSFLRYWARRQPPA